MTNVQTLERPRKSGRQKPKAAAKQQQALPPVTPHIVCEGAAEAIAFYKKAFGAAETMRVRAPATATCRSRIGGRPQLDGLRARAPRSRLPPPASSARLRFSVSAPTPGVETPACRPR